VTDNRGRQLERAWRESGSREDLFLWLRSQVQSGSLPEWKVVVASGCRVEACWDLLSTSPGITKEAGVKRFAHLFTELAFRADPRTCLAYVYHALELCDWVMGTHLPMGGEVRIGVMLQQTRAWVKTESPGWPRLVVSKVRQSSVFGAIWKGIYACMSAAGKDKEKVEIHDESLVVLIGEWLDRNAFFGDDHVGAVKAEQAIRAGLKRLSMKLVIGEDLFEYVFADQDKRRTQWPRA